jgi:predicted HicB family RNase H-like nuclease
MSTLSHKEYLAAIEVDAEAGIFHGRVINTRAVLTFHGHTVGELEAAFAETIATYEDWCKERGKEPERPYSGQLTLRMSPQLHKRVADAALKSGKSLSGFVRETLEHVT